MVLNQDNISFAISVLAFLISIYSLIKTNRMDRFELLIRRPQYKNYGDYTRLTLTIFNNSVRPIKIESLYFSSNSKPIPIVDFNVDDYYDDLQQKKYDSLSPLGKASFSWMYYRVSDIEKPSISSDILINVNDSVLLTYYLTDNPQTIDLTITANEKLTPISKTKTYSLIPTYPEEDN